MHSLQCPICRLPLLQKHKHGRLIHSCPQYHGIALPTSVARRWLRAEALPAFDASLAAPRQGKKPCPRCQEAMKEFGSALKLDSCARCSLLWFDANELDRLWKRPDRELESEGEKKSLVGIEEGLGELFPSLEGLELGAAKFPTITLLLILACTVVSKIGISADGLKFVFDPQHPFAKFGLMAVLSIMAHADMGHLSGNMIPFFFAGMIVEACFGEAILLQIFFLCGLIGTALQGVLYPHVGSLGASGAVSGVLTVLCLTQPKASLVTRRTRFNGWGEFYTITLRIPVWLLFLAFVGFQVEGGMAQSRGGGGGIGFFAHLGGILAGAVFVFTSQLKVMVPAKKK
jgi:membrane associated rhomboid family serine protease